MNSTNRKSPARTYNRRDFLRNTAATAAGLTLAVHFPATAQSLTASIANPQRSPLAFEPNAFIRIHADNTVTVIIKLVELGQGALTGLATLVAEELDADWSQIRSEHAPVDSEKYFNNVFLKLFGQKIQSTGGSTGLSYSYMQMRQAGAAAKYMLRMAAAESWNVPLAEITVKSGIVSHEGSNRHARFGELVAAAARQNVPEEVTLKDPKDFVFIGRDHLPRKDTGKTNGTAVFTQDINLPGQVTAVVAHAPGYGYRLKGFDDTETRHLNGIVEVKQIPTGVAVIAKDYWTAKKGRDLLKLDWDDSNAFKMDSAEIMAQYREMAKQDGAAVARSDGDIKAGFEKADRIIEASYEYPYLAHATMEPMNCVVQVHEDSCELWYGAQGHTFDQDNVASLLGIPPENVAINTLYAGGSFGRRGTVNSDYVLEAVHVAKNLKTGVPVKLVWSREDDTRAGYFRPMFYHRIRAGLDENGLPVAWQHRIVGQSHFAGTRLKGVIQNGVDFSTVDGAAGLPYRIPNIEVDMHTPENIGVPITFWRSVGTSHNTFTVETFIDELAAAAGADPVAYRMEYLQDHPRYLAVLKLAAEKAGWGTPLPANRARGVAVYYGFESYAAEVAEITLAADGSFEVDRIVCAIDCGVAVNPDIVRAQVEGGIGFGLSATLMSEVTLEKGRVVQSNFHDYRVLRLNQMPDIEVHIVKSSEAPTGAGETSVPLVAPAVANALFAATGKRHYRLPLPRNVITSTEVSRGMHDKTFG